MAAKPGMPQLDVTTWMPQLVWVAICFVVLYAVISKIAIPGVGGAIRARASQIGNDLAAAQKLKAQTDAAAAAYEASLATARGKASAIAQDNRNAVAVETGAGTSKIDAELAARIKSAETAIAASKTKALAGVQDVAAEIAADIVAALTGAKVSAADAAKAVAKIGS